MGPLPAPLIVSEGSRSFNFRGANSSCLTVATGLTLSVLFRSTKHKKQTRRAWVGSLDSAWFPERPQSSCIMPFHPAPPTIFPSPLRSMPSSVYHRPLLQQHHICSSFVGTCSAWAILTHLIGIQICLLPAGFITTWNVQCWC